MQVNVYFVILAGLGLTVLVYLLQKNGGGIRRGEYSRAGVLFSMEFCRLIVCRLHGLAMLRFISFAALPFLLAGLLHAQSTNASPSGRITGSSKAVLRNAKMITINIGPRVHYETVTNETGSYDVTNLPTGTYRIEVEKLGFKVVIKSDLVLHVQDALKINFEMTLGSASESVTVRGGAPPFYAESSTIGTIVEQRES